MDGVLVNAKEWHFEALNKALTFYGYVPISHADHLVYYDGLPTHKKLALLAEAQPIPSSQFRALHELKQKLTVEIAQQKCAPMLLHLKTLQKLRESGYVMAVCSNSVRATIDLLMDKTALMPFFAFTLSNEDVSQPKPHPEIYMTAMQRLNILPSESLILEDNINGLQAARASGGHVLEIKDIHEVNYENILCAIDAIERH